MKSGSLNLLDPSRPRRPVTGMLYLLLAEFLANLLFLLLIWRFGSFSIPPSPILSGVLRDVNVSPTPGRYYQGDMGEVTCRKHNGGEERVKDICPEEPDSKRQIEKHEYGWHNNIKMTVRNFLIRLISLVLLKGVSSDKLLAK